MSFEPNERQALLLWIMIIGATPEERQPMWSGARPKLAPRERTALVKHGFVERRSGRSQKGARADFMALTDKAWEWASRARGVEIMQSRFAGNALQGLLRRLVPFCERREIALADLFRDEPHEHLATGIAQAPAASTAPGSAGGSLRSRIEQACLSLAGGAKKSRVQLSALRRALPAISRLELDTALIDLQRERRLVLYREDNTPALSAEDHAAALLIGDSPRHLVYLEA